MDENDKSAEENDETTLESDADTTIEDMEKFLTVYNAFIQQVMEFEWPDEHPLTEDPKMQRMLFQMFWQQRHRQRMNDERMERRRNRESNGDEEDFNFKAASKENFKRFLRHQMEANNNDDEFEKNTRFIDPGEATPDGEHSTDEAVGRRERFREEWE
ncbi:hypothetical protein N9M68_00425 [Candidatus Poseidonia alphae]|nr:hypothetical protein [Candidatus Poseidonia alphae]